MTTRSVKSLVAAASLALSLTAASLPVMAAEVIEVVLDQVKIIQLPEKAVTLVIGNPLVVDVTMLRGNNKMILTGKGFGQTQVVALDAAGEAIGESLIKVSADDTKNLVVQRGVERESYQCNQRCQLTYALGDSTRHMGETAGQMTARNGVMAGAGGAQR
jgi:hypothetical protein